MAETKMKLPEKASDRLVVLERIREYEQKGWFDRDVEDDPPTSMLMPNKVDYTNKRITSKISTFIANIVARRFFDKQIRKNKLIIKQVCGIENYRSVSGGAILTCNHFNAFDNYAVYKVIQKDLRPRELYKVIREGNYTSFKGLYGYFFRHCNTIPLSTNLDAMKQMMKGVKELLQRGEKILIYPEQGMWWNYKKPRPMKSGAFQFAAANNVPVIPFFITMNDSEFMGEDGFPIQEYTVHIMEPIYPDPKLSVKQNAEQLKVKNYDILKCKYEEVYGLPLKYDLE